MSYKAFSALKEKAELAAIEGMTSSEINAVLNSQHDKIQALTKLIKEADEYLDTNSLTSIGSGSSLHKKFKDAINTQPKR